MGENDPEDGSVNDDDDDDGNDDDDAYENKSGSGTKNGGARVDSSTATQINMTGKNSIIILVVEIAAVMGGVLG